MDRYAFSTARNRGGIQAIVNTKVGPRDCFVLKDLSRINDHVKETFIEEFFPMTIQAYRQRSDNAWFRDAVEHRMFNSDALILVFGQDQRGIGIWTFDEVEFKYGVHDDWGIYVSMISIRQDYQGLGMHKGLLDVSHKFTVRGHFDFTVCRTQNPIVANAWWSKYGNVYPLANKPDDQIRTVAEIAAKKVGFSSIYEPDKMIVRGVYNGEALHGEPFHIGNCLDERLYELINYRQGDAVVLVSKT